MKTTPPQGNERTLPRDKKRTKNRENRVGKENRVRDHVSGFQRKEEDRTGSVDLRVELIRLCGEGAQSWSVGVYVRVEGE